MKFKFLALLITAFSISGYGQDIQVLSNFTNDSYRLTNMIEKDINSKWSYFGITEVGSEYDKLSEIKFESNQYFNYALKNNFALTTGFGFVLPSIKCEHKKSLNFFKSLILCYGKQEKRKNEYQ
jgi:hypothetical protein